MKDKRNKTGKIKNKGSFNEVFGPDYFDHIDSLINRMKQNLEPGFHKLPSPFFYGFSVIKNSEEESEIREFGSLYLASAGESGGEQKCLIQKHKPLIYLIEKDNEIYVTAELPGISKGQIILKATDSFLDLKASHGERKYSERVLLPSKVDPDSARATCRNGILEVILKVFDAEKTVLVCVE
ncbi:Hsp20/alpha crystallin family protein [uncultured Methanomethylovorans sp.]|uniref:Hsp20/alpha crystallin family protein n=1 Tax=uncultured Methanomethylovorans sp. TaxID=183759 RepID=UPI002AA7D3C5|nr:Hsp20/alpha crystallin family protein [uncultured Methanomethylovorans sp.]